MDETATMNAQQIESIKPNGWFLAFGIILAFAGVFAIMTPVATTIMTTIFLGWFLIFSGIIQFVAAIVNRKIENMWLGMFMGVLGFIAGLLIVTNMLSSLVAITMLIGIFFFVDGVSKSIMSIVKRPEHWGWMLASGLISLFLAITILTKVLVSTALLLGTLLGVYMIFAGMEMIVVYYLSKK